MNLTFLTLPENERTLYINQTAIQSMRAMYLEEPASFDEIISTLRELEQKINSN